VFVLFLFHRAFPFLGHLLEDVLSVVKNVDNGCRLTGGRIKVDDTQRPAWLARARESAKTSSLFGVHSESLSYVHFLH
jgi:hypothetical protein